MIQTFTSQPIPFNNTTSNHSPKQRPCQLVPTIRSQSTSQFRNPNTIQNEQLQVHQRHHLGRHPLRLQHPNLGEARQSPNKGRCVLKGGWDLLLPETKLRLQRLRAGIDPTRLRGAISPLLLDQGILTQNSTDGLHSKSMRCITLHLSLRTTSGSQSSMSRVLECLPERSNRRL